MRLGQKEKLLTSVKNNPKDREYRELVSLLTKYGFVVVDSQGKGSHCPVYHSIYKDLRWTLSRHKPMKTFHAKKVVSLIEEVIMREEN